MSLNTIVRIYRNNQYATTVRTRRDFIKFLGVEPLSRNENCRRWNTPAPDAVKSLCPIDECFGYGRDITVYFHFERLISGNAKQRRAWRRKHLRTNIK